MSEQASKNASLAPVCKRFAKSVRVSDFAMPLPLPLKIRRRAESYAIEDAGGRVIAYFYFEDALELRRTITKRLTEAEAREAAQIAARALTEASGPSAPAS
jgi:hypothetical protein